MILTDKSGHFVPLLYIPHCRNYHGIEAAHWGPLCRYITESRKLILTSSELRLSSRLSLAALLYSGVRTAGEPHHGHHHQPRHQGGHQGRDDPHQDGADPLLRAGHLLHTLLGAGEAGETVPTGPRPLHHLALAVTERGRHLPAVQSLLQYWELVRGHAANLNHRQVSQKRCKVGKVVLEDWEVSLILPIHVTSCKLAPGGIQGKGSSIVPSKYSF